MKLHVEVTQEDIDTGTCHKANDCMVRRAFMRATEGAFPDVLIFPLTGIFLDGHYSTNKSIRLPERVPALIVGWDAGVPTKPFSFDIDLPIDPAVFVSAEDTTDPREGAVRALPPEGND